MMDEKIIIVSLILIFVFFLFNKFNHVNKHNIEKFNNGNQPIIEGEEIVENSCKDSPEYNPNKWNKEQCLKASHNCYSYMLNKTKKKLVKLCEDGYKIINPQPGHYCGLVKKVIKSTTTCKNLSDRVLCDNPNIYMVDDNETKCKEGYYKGALAVAPGITYHFYRQDNDCTWSHKDGGREATNVDASENIIMDPKDSNRKFSEKRNYKDFCGYFCIPKNDLFKNMSRRRNGETWY
jgi:hypothetical protein